MDTRTKNEIRKSLAETAAPRLPLPLAYSDPAFAKCMDEACRTPELVQAFDRLTGCKIGSLAKRAPIERMVDEVTGFRDDQMRQFVEFVHDSIYLRLPDEAINAFRLASEIQSDTPQ